MKWMNGILTINFRAGPDSIDVYCGRLEVALRELKFRLQAQYERRFPGEAMRIRQAISQAETWHGTPTFRICFFRIWRRKRLTRLSFSSKSEHKDESSNLAHVASGVR